MISSERIAELISFLRRDKAPHTKVSLRCVVNPFKPITGEFPVADVSEMNPTTKGKCKGSGYGCGYLDCTKDIVVPPDQKGKVVSSHGDLYPYITPVPIPSEPPLP